MMQRYSLDEINEGSKYSRTTQDKDWVSYSEALAEITALKEELTSLKDSKAYDCSNAHLDVIIRLQRDNYILGKLNDGFPPEIIKLEAEITALELRNRELTMCITAKIREFETICENRRSQEADAKIQEEMERDLRNAKAYNSSLKFIFDKVFGEEYGK